MTRHETIIAGRSKRPVQVEHRSSRWSRRDIHNMGLAAVAHALGLHDEGLGGVMTGGRVSELLGRRGKPRAAKETKPKTNQDAKAPSLVLVPGALAADISRNIFPDRQRQFGVDLIGGVL